jgi:hypothetical protein
MLGYFSLGILYGFLAIGCLISTAVMNRVGVKNSLIIGSLCDSIWIFTSIFPALRSSYPNSNSLFLSDGFIYFSVIFSSMIDGLGDAL